MNAVLGPIRDLVDRRLWPVAVVLVAAVLAVPLLLTDREDAPPPAATATAPRDAGLGAAGIVSAAGPDGVARRRVLGAPKDPFKPTGEQPRPDRTPSAGVSTASGGRSGAAPTASTAAAGGSQGTGSTGGGSAPVASPPLSGPPPTSIPNPAVPAPARPRSPRPELFSLRIRFDGSLRTLRRLKPLPDAENAAIIYLGVLEDGKTAVFLLDAAVRAQGDGACDPSPRDCQRLHLRKGETAFFDVGGEDGPQYQLDLIDIHAKPAGKAAAARTSASAAGRRALRSRTDRLGRLRYDARTGRLRELSIRDWSAQVDRSR